MKMMNNLMKTSCMAFAIVAWTSVTNAAVIPVSGWIVHNGTSTVGGTASNPTFTAGDNITLMAPFADVVLANDGDFVEGKTTLTMNTRTGTGINTLNTQLRFALLDDSVKWDSNRQRRPQYWLHHRILRIWRRAGLFANKPAPAQTNPFTSPTNIGNGVQDSGADSIQGANPGPVTFDLKLTRNGGKLDLTGSISGTDSVSTNPYLADIFRHRLQLGKFPGERHVYFQSYRPIPGRQRERGECLASGLQRYHDSGTCVVAFGRGTGFWGLTHETTTNAAGTGTCRPRIMMTAVRE